MYECLSCDRELTADNVHPLCKQCHKELIKPELRKGILDFSVEMGNKLKNNDWKESWKDEKVTLRELFWSLQGEIYELYEALKHTSPTGDQRAIVNECADIANFAMMIADKCKI